MKKSQKKSKDEKPKATKTKKPVTNREKIDAILKDVNRQMNKNLTYSPKKGKK